MIIALAGLSKSGKSSLARHLGAKLGWPVLSFGSYVRHVAVTTESTEDFSTLQALGQSMVEKDPAVFVSAVFAHAGRSRQENLILDGLRHVEVLEALQEFVSPSAVYLVLVEVRHEELRRRHQLVGQDLAEILAGPAEQQVQSSLPQRANLVVDGEAPIALTVEIVLERTEVG